MYAWSVLGQACIAGGCEWVSEGGEEATLLGVGEVEVVSA